VSFQPHTVDVVLQVFQAANSDMSVVLSFISTAICYIVQQAQNSNWLVSNACSIKH